VQALCRCVEVVYTPVFPPQKKPFVEDLGRESRHIRGSEQFSVLLSEL
jgi:hypothetical protein